MKTRRPQRSTAPSRRDVKYANYSEAQQTKENFLKLLQSRSTKLESETKGELSKKCIICCTETTKITKDDDDKTKELINFIAEDCLGMEDLKRELNNSRDLSTSHLFCQFHLEAIKEALELAKMIKELEAKLIEIKFGIRAGVVKCLEEFCSEASPIFASSSVKVKVEDEELNDADDGINFDFLEIDPMLDVDNILVKTIQPSLPVILLERITDLNIGRIAAENNVKVNFASFVKKEGDYFHKNEDGDGMFEDEFFVDNNDSDWDENHELEEEEEADESIKLTRQITSNKRKRKAKEIQGPRIRKRVKKETSKKPRINKKRYQCQVCNKMFDAIEERNSHRDAEHGKGPYFRCKVCSMEFRQISSLQMHTTRVHSGLERTFLCELCPFTFFLLNDLQKHKERCHSSKNKEIVTCSICNNGKKYIGNRNLSRHIQVYHESGEVHKKNLICEFCGKVYHSEDAFKVHKAKTHLGTYLPAVCDVCGKKLSDSRSLKKHKFSQHFKSYQFKCELCGAGSLFRSHLAAHLKSAHPKIPQKRIEELMKNSKKVVDNSKAAILERDRANEIVSAVTKPEESESHVADSLNKNEAIIASNDILCDESATFTTDPVNHVQEFVEEEVPSEISFSLLLDPGPVV